jgi:hypothetical protein
MGRADAECYGPRDAMQVGDPALPDVSAVGMIRARNPP